MKCLFCKQGETRPGRVTVVLQRGDLWAASKSTTARHDLG
jgi:hypothetical protein